MGSDDGDRNREQGKNAKALLIHHGEGEGKEAGMWKAWTTLTNNELSRKTSVMVMGRQLQTKMRLCGPKVAHLRGLFRQHFLLLLPEKLGPERVRGNTTNKSTQNF